jgi:hypothetical protein
MARKEIFLLHQVHPIKLATDISAAVISLYYFWKRELVVGLLTHIVPPPLGSAIVIRFADLERYENSRLGAYLFRYMIPAAQATRLAGDLVTFFAAWLHSPAGIAAGLIITLAAWRYGLLRRKRDSE